MSVLVPTSLAEALAALADGPGRVALAGGTDLMVLVNEGHRHLDTESVIVAVDRIPELDGWRLDPQGQDASDGRVASLWLGAGLRWSEIEHGPIAERVPALAQAARTVGSPQIRAAGTIGGNIATSSPAGDGLPVLAALDAVVHLASAGGTRDIPFAEFMTGPKRNVLAGGELVTGVTVPVFEGWQGYSKVGVRNAMVISTASACLVHDRAGGTVRIALGSVGPVIIRCTAAEELLASRLDLRSATAVSDSVVTEVAALVREAARPIDDHRSTAAYRRHAVGVLAERLVRRAFPDG
jgi:CO/xanthine dehydrogenase FAD-binding subunit